MDLIVNTMQKTLDNTKYQNNGPIIPTDKASFNNMEISKTVEEKPSEQKPNEYNQENLKEKSNQELLVKLLKSVPGRTRSEFTYHKEVNRISIKVINEDTQEVIREIPPEKSLEILKQLMEIEGLFVDERR